VNDRFGETCGRSEPEPYGVISIIGVVFRPIKPNPPKDGDGKPRVLASSATLPIDATKDPKTAELPKRVSFSRIIIWS